MAFRKLLLLNALVAVLLISTTGLSQVDVPGPRFQYRDLEEPDNTRPAATPGVYEYDAQIFAPVEFTDNDELGPNNGFYFTIDKLYTSITSGGSLGDSPGNYIWGIRYEGGYMNTNEDGWHVVYEQSEGNEIFNGFGLPPFNAFGTQLTTKFGVLEVNKVYRQELKQGGWFEPYIGLRYYNVSDTSVEDFGLGIIGGVASNRFRQRVTNDMVGLNVGGRLVRRRGRWRYSHNVSIAPTYNQRRLLATDLTTIVNTTFPTEVAASDNTFVPAVDYRFELAYNLTRDFGLRAGGSINYLWNGIARVNTAPAIDNPNSTFGDPTLPRGGLYDNYFLAAGFSFGMEYRR